MSRLMQSVQQQQLIEDYNRFRRWKGIHLREAIKTKPPMAVVNYGFEEHFGPGKSPFIVEKMLIMDDTLHILVIADAFRHPKWEWKLAGWLGPQRVIFYDKECAEEYVEWMRIRQEFEETMSKAIWSGIEGGVENR